MGEHASGQGSGPDDGSHRRGDRGGASAGTAGDGPARPGDAAVNRVMMDRIAAPFAASRQEPWEPVVRFLQELRPGTRLLDLAGGNGRHAIHAARLGLVPVVADVSGALVRMALDAARQEGVGVQAIEADAAELPFRGASIDAALFIAGVHCIRTAPARIWALAELRRTLRAEAPALVSVWSAGQDRFRETVARQREEEAQGTLPAELEVGDVLVPWAKDVATPVARFFHVYTEPELRRELDTAGFVVERIDAVTLTRSSRPDNLFARVRATR